jgi:hypothetical protein
MSQQRPLKKPVIVAEEEEPEEFEDDEEFGDEEEGLDLLDALGSWFTTEDGETVATALVGLRTAVEMQNKIMVKMLSALNKIQPCKCVVTEPVQPESA